MRLIDADALDIDNLNRAYDDNFELDFGRLYTADVIDIIANAPTINAISIPDNATNGDVIKAVFPNTNIEYWAEYSTYNVEFPNDNDVKHFSYDWWNAKYKGVLE